jgi:hypothetical protein
LLLTHPLISVNLNQLTLVNEMWIWTTWVQKGHLDINIDQISDTLYWISPDLALSLQIIIVNSVLDL